MDSVMALFLVEGANTYCRADITACCPYYRYVAGYLLCCIICMYKTLPPSSLDNIQVYKRAYAPVQRYALGFKYIHLIDKTVSPYNFHS